MRWLNTQFDQPTTTLTSTRSSGSAILAFEAAARSAAQAQAVQHAGGGAGGADEDHDHGRAGSRQGHPVRKDRPKGAHATLYIIAAWRCCLLCVLVFSPRAVGLTFSSHFTQHNLVHISVGDLLRAEVAAGTPAGTQAREFMESGRLVPNGVRAAYSAGVLTVSLLDVLLLQIGSTLLLLPPSQLLSISCEMRRLWWTW